MEPTNTMPSVVTEEETSVVFVENVVVAAGAESAAYSGTVLPDTGAPHGRGSLTYANGDTYSGDWCRNRRHGKGVMRYQQRHHPDGDNHQDEKTEAANHDSAFDIMARWMRQGGAGTYDGEWRADVSAAAAAAGGVFHGHGTFTYFFPSPATPTTAATTDATPATSTGPDASVTDNRNNNAAGSSSSGGVVAAVYQGEWVEGLAHGSGQLRYPDGSAYEGGWSCGVPNGVGTWSGADGSRYEGPWTKGQRDTTAPSSHLHLSSSAAAVCSTPPAPLPLAATCGTYWYPNGSVYRGGWAQNVPHGRGAVVYANGASFRGAWHRGALVGELTPAEGAP